LAYFLSYRLSSDGIPLTNKRIKVIKIGPKIVNHDRPWRKGKAKMEDLFLD